MSSLLSLIHLLLSFLSTPSPNLIFILAGQSNMAGRGGVAHNKWDRIVPPESHPSPSVLRLNPHLLWEQAREPLHAGIDTGKACGVGPGLILANAVGPGMGGTVLGLVPCAKGGTRIAEWARGRWLYRRMVRRAKAAAAEGRVEAVVWYQGESDTKGREDAERYRGRMEQLVRDLREDLGDPGLLVIQVGVIFILRLCLVGEKVSERKKEEGQVEDPLSLPLPSPILSPMHVSTSTVVI